MTRHGHTGYLLAAGVVVLSLTGGCSMSSMEKKAREVTGRSEKTDSRVELNTAGRKRLAGLPGLNGTDADRIIANRPYQNRRDLVRKGVLSEAQFAKMKDSVYVEHGND
jgi:DNA uptake protein ComE-like DNA-binding protein